MSAYEYDVCPKCGGDIPVRTWLERHPYGDTYASERHCETLPCRDCGWDGE